MKTKKYLIPILMSLVTACSFFTQEKKAESDVKSLGRSDDVRREIQNLANHIRKAKKQGGLNSGLFQGSQANRNFQETLKKFKEQNNLSLKAASSEKVLTQAEIESMMLDFKRKMDEIDEQFQRQTQRQLQVLWGLQRDLIELLKHPMNEAADLLKKNGVIPVEDAGTKNIVRMFQLTNDQYQSGLNKFNAQIALLEVMRTPGYVKQVSMIKDKNGYYRYIGEGANTSLKALGTGTPDMTLKDFIIIIRKVAEGEAQNAYTKILAQTDPDPYLNRYLLGEAQHNQAFLEATRYLE